MASPLYEGGCAVLPPAFGGSPGIHFLQHLKLVSVRRLESDEGGPRKDLSQLTVGEQANGVAHRDAGVKHHGFMLRHGGEELLKLIGGDPRPRHFVDQHIGRVGGEKQVVQGLLPGSAAGDADDTIGTRVPLALLLGTLKIGRAHAHHDVSGKGRHCCQGMAKKAVVMVIEEGLRPAAEALTVAGSQDQGGDLRRSAAGV